MAAGELHDFISPPGNNNNNNLINSIATFPPLPHPLLQRQLKGGVQHHLGGLVPAYTTPADPPLDDVGTAGRLFGGGRQFDISGSAPAVSHVGASSGALGIAFGGSVAGSCPSSGALGVAFGGSVAGSCPPLPYGGPLRSTSVAALHRHPMGSSPTPTHHGGQSPSLGSSHTILILGSPHSTMLGFPSSPTPSS